MTTPKNLVEILDPTLERQPTMADVARIADVSTAAVSYFLSGRSDLLKRVGADAQGRIREAVQQLGYVQNKTARQLRRQRSDRLCVLLPRLGIPFADKMAQDIDAAARLRGFSTIVVAGQAIEDWRRVLGEIEAGLADGVVADADPFTEDELAELFEPLARLGKPCVILHPTAAPTLFSVVREQRIEALQVALDHLLAIGRRRLAYMANQLERANPRAELVQAFAERHRDAIELSAVTDGANQREAAAATTRKLLVRSPRPDAILVESDFAAVTVIEELQRAGLNVPSDIAVIGCGNAEEGYFCHPRLTTIGPVSMSLTVATGHLIDAIENRGNSGRQRFVVPWKLYLRESA